MPPQFLLIIPPASAIEELEDVVRVSIILPPEAEVELPDGVLARPAGPTAIDEHTNCMEAACIALGGHSDLSAAGPPGPKGACTFNREELGTLDALARATYWTTIESVKCLGQAGLKGILE
jgi:hypothetical protein